MWLPLRQQIDDRTIGQKVSRNLRGVTWDHPRAYQPLEAAANEHAAARGARVIWDRRSLKDFGDQSIADLAHRYDLLVIDHPHVGSSAAQRNLLPLDEHLDPATLRALAEDSPGGSHQSYHYGGHQWALAIDAACQVAARRPDLLPGVLKEPSADQSSWPATWDDVLRLATHLRRDGRWIGMALCPTDCVCCLLTLLAQSGSPVHGDLTELSLQVVAAALDRMRQLKKHAHPESTSWNPIQLYDAMAQSDDIAYSPLSFGYVNYSCSGFRGAPLAFGPIPGKVGSLLGGAGIAVSRHTVDPNGAVAFAAYVASEACQADIYAQSGGQPAHPKVWQVPKDHNVGPFVRGTRETMRQAFTRPRSSWWSDFQPQLGTLTHECLLCNIDSSRMARVINERYQECREAECHPKSL